jgi:hypothetical protein
MAHASWLIRVVRVHARGGLGGGDEPLVRAPHRPPHVLAGHGLVGRGAVDVLLELVAQARLLVVLDIPTVEARSHLNHRETLIDCTT